MGPQYYPLDMNQNEVLNHRLHVLAAAPSSPVSGQIYFDSGLDKVGVRTVAGTWAYFGTGMGTVTSVGLSVPSTMFDVSGSPVTTSGTLTFTLKTQAAGLVFAGPATGADAAPTFRQLQAADIPTLTSAKISDFNATVRTNRLDQMAAPQANISMGGFEITNVGTPTASTSAATKAYVDLVAQGLDPKPGATVATTAALPANTYVNGTSGVGATITANANGALTVDGYAVAVGDIVLVKDEASTAKNGLYTVTQTGSGAAPFILTRHESMDTAGEFRQAYIVVEDAGTTNRNTIWVNTNSADPTVGSTGITFSQVRGAADLQAGNMMSITGTTVAVKASTAAERAASNLVGSFTADFGDGAATTFQWNQAAHGLRSDGRMTVQIYRNSDDQLVGAKVTVGKTTGTVTVVFATAPASNSFRVVITG